ncbi:fibronectin type-III domain-containing protein 3A-like isoform X2 [Lineus longissimus]|uniref:fibronectin type-III domain-containing protein 3A-like isoform X2 n=1 Tax=Lineus longissimus TaxID=88925 RepID=UPI00315D5F62
MKKKGKVMKDKESNMSDQAEKKTTKTTSSEVTQNGHTSPTENGMSREVDAQTGQMTYTIPAQNARGHSPNSLSRPAPGHRGNSPNRYSPNQAQSRDTSPQTNHANHEHVVHVHVNPGETFSVRVGDQIQFIQGPATVRMVSNNGPPMPMPMQVPPGHMVQQIVDENGILTHVILSQQPPGPGMGPSQPMTVGYYGGPNSPPQQVYPTYGPQYSAHYPNQYPPQPHQPHHGAPPHMHHVAPPHMHSTPPPHQCNNHSHAHPHIHPTQGPPPSHHNHSSHMDDRAIQQKAKLQDKLRKRHKEGYYNAQNVSPRKNKGKMNGDIRKNEVHSSSSSGDGQEIEEEQRLIQEILSKMQLPKISNVESRSALIVLIPPECNNQDFNIDQADFKYELLLSDKGKDGKYKLVYSGDATEITLQDLKPATEYHLRVSALLDDIKGDTTESVSFKTKACEPDAPSQPKLASRTKTMLQLKWSATSDNGSKIVSYVLEYDQGRGDGRESSFTEVYSGSQKQYKMTKLNASTGYVFRLASVNSIGKSPFCEQMCYFTSGSAPSQPDPPMLSDRYVKALTISWIRRPNDETFTLQMEDEATGHGFMSVYNGPDLSHTIKNLRRNTEYKYRLCANNEEGNSRWSDTVCYRTKPDRPGAPGKLQVKGKVHSASFKVIWDAPKDSGGTEITKYVLELDEGRGFDIVYEGAEREFICDRLKPGHTYRLRVSCVSAGGHSDNSDSCSVTTLAMAPGPCQSPKLQGKPKATSLHLRWLYPDTDGGAGICEYEVRMTLPDNTSREVYKGRDLDCVVAGLSPGRPYLFHVRAFNKAGAGTWSDALEVVSGAGVPDPPKAPVAHCRSSHCAIINWEEPVNNGATITDYKLEWQQKAEADYMQLYFGAALNHEVRGLQPATTYNFRVQAINSAGPGPFSAISSCITPPSSPGPVVSFRGIPTATSIKLTWKEPHDNGSEIISYNIDLGDRHLSVGNELEYTILDLVPETTYKIRIQAVNGIGVGSFSAPMKITTRALPPPPPRLECLSCGPNTLKLKWGDGKNPDLIQYCLEMMRDNGSFYNVYQGTSHNHKVSKLNELTEYSFRICASNEAGQGDRSEEYAFRTTKAPPPAIRPPKISDITTESCVIEWSPCRPMGHDSILYIVQMQNSRESEYKQIYKGSETSFSQNQLQAKTEYLVRVCAIRQCCDDTGDLIGAFSPGVSFITQSIQPIKSSTSKAAEVKQTICEPRQWTDKQQAMIILAAFTVFAIVMAMLAQQLVQYTMQD